MVNYRELNIRDLRRRVPGSGVDSSLENDVFVAEMRYVPDMDILKYPCRFDGFLAFYCLEGRFDIEMNLQTIEMCERSLLVYVPGNIMRISGMSETEKENVHFIVVAVSSEMMNGVRVDFKRLYDESVRLFDKPCVVLDEAEEELCGKYYDLAREISLQGPPKSVDALTLLISSALSLVGSLWGARISEARSREQGRSRRSRALMEDFLALVHEHHTRERCLAFYADRLFLTPKYLSKLVKEVSGKSAHEWIDDFVVLEAKNMLKYSELSIKTIVYELNFPNQTTFYRFFKAHTGMTPSEYRKA